ncbi:MAG: hypothetical protein QM757_09730 [Paludibaculum sp.]
MAVSELYIAQFLLEATQASDGPLQWHLLDGGSYCTQLNGVRLTLFHSRSMGWSGICLSFSQGDEVTYIEEPHPVTLFSRKFSSDDDMHLSDTLNGLARAVSSQCNARKVKAWGLRDSIRESLFRRVLFPDADPQ